MEFLIESLERCAAHYRAEGQSQRAEDVDACAAMIWAFSPTVIRDRRPTRAEVEAAMVDGVSRWIWVGVSGSFSVWEGRVFVEADRSRFLDIPTQVQIPGEIWRPINPDGSPMRLEVKDDP